MVDFPLDIDAIVRQVLADLSARGASMPNARPGLSPNAKPGLSPGVQQALPKNVGHEKATLRLPGSLVTLASLEGRLDGVREVVIQPKAIVTPSVRDLLYKKEIKLALGQAAEKPAATGKPANSTQTAQAGGGPTGVASPVWLGLHALKREPETLIAFLQGAPSFVRESFGCVIKTVNAAVDWLTAQSQHAAARAVIVTNYSAAAMAVANRVSTLRAVAGLSPEQTAQDAAMIGANMLVLHADRLGAYKMKEIARTFLANKIVTCPNDLLAALE